MFFSFALYDNLRPVGRYACEGNNKQQNTKQETVT